jgi:hypothetical protein
MVHKEIAQYLGTTLKLGIERAGKENPASLSPICGEV